MIAASSSKTLDTHSSMGHIGRASLHGLRLLRLPPFAVLGCGVAISLVWVLSVLPMAATLGLCAAVAVCAVAAGVDVSERRLPNGLLAAAGGVVVLMTGTAVMSGDVGLVEGVTGMSIGVVLCGAPLLFGLWLARPESIGGGDVKMLTVVGAALGVSDPLAALVAGWTAVVVQLALSVAFRRSQLPFGPALCAGFAVGVVSTRWFNSTIGPL